MPLTKENKNKLISDFGRNAKDTGSAESQVAMLTERINGLTPHFEKNTKDNHSRFGLLRMVGRRKKLLLYLSKTNFDGYKKLIARLDLRK